jgi:hypothetical protein
MVDLANSAYLKAASSGEIMVRDCRLRPHIPRCTNDQRVTDSVILILQNYIANITVLFVDYYTNLRR